MSLRGFIIISGIFGKSSDLDILPPPPPFPDIGLEEKPKRAARELRTQQKQRKIKAKKKAKVPKLISSIGKEEIELPKLEQKRSFFGRLFGKKDEEFEREMEELEKIKPGLKEPKLVTKRLPELKIPEIKVKAPKPKKEKIEPIKDISAIKLPKLEIGESAKLDLEKAQEEIRKSIESIQWEKKTSVIGGLFKRKEKEKVMEKIETPEVTPRTFDKIDHVQEIEERIHKARMYLMDFRFEDAKRVYVEIMRIYNSSEPKDRAKVYNDVRDLYYERKSAERFAKR